MNYQNLIDQIVTTKQGREFFVEYVKINRKGAFVAELGNNQLVNVDDLVLDKEVEEKITSPQVSIEINNPSLAYAQETRKNPQSSSKKPKREKQEEQSVCNSNEPAQEVKKPGQEEVDNEKTSETEPNV